MNQTLSRIALATLGMALTAATLNATAGTATVRSSEGDEITYEYSRSAVRMGMDGEKAYSLVRDGKMYGVMFENGEYMLIDASSMMQGFSSLIQDNAPDELTAEIITMKKTSRKETVAGVSGRVYEVTVKTKNGEERTEEVVLSTDKKAREFTDALFLMAEAASAIAGAEAQASASDMRRRLDDLDSGVLRYGNDLVLTDISSKSIADDRFELPAEPIDLGGLGAMLGGMSANMEDADSDDDSEAPAEAGGVFSSMMGALGKKADRQTDRVGSSVDNEIDRETDEAVDKGVNKIFGKLFGNR